MWKYNQEEPLKEITDSITNPFIIHYTTFKPWKDLNVMMGSYFWRYARMSTFYEQILMNFIDKKMKRLLDVNTEGPKEESKRISKVMLGRKIRLLEIRERKNEVEYYLFARIPLLKIRTREKYKDIYLISWRLHILRINYK
jgi:hypothetical protein